MNMNNDPVKVRLRLRCRPQVLSLILEMRHYSCSFVPGEDERFPGETEEEIAKMRRKRMIKKRSKLEESFPSYLQVFPSISPF